MLSGTIPDTFANLTGAYKIVLSRNQLNGELPRLVSLTLLEELFVIQSFITLYAFTNCRVNSGMFRKTN
jgi:hypothetical protein